LPWDLDAASTGDGVNQRLFVIAATFFFFGASLPASADIILYLNNVKFADGGTATGSFPYLDFKGVDITTSPYGQFGTNYAGSLSGGQGSAFYSGYQFQVSLSIGNGLSEQIQLEVFQNFSPTSQNPLLTSPPSGWPNYSRSFEDIFAGCCENNYRYIVSGTIGPELTSSVPELSTWAMMLIGFAAVGFAVRRRSKICSAAIALPR
jgi:hypothetical protein